MSQHIASLEASLIGAVFLQQDTFDLLDVKAADFFDPRAAVAWEAMRALREQQRPIDSVTVELEAVARGCNIPPAYLGECAAHCPTVDNAIEYARLVKQEAVRRRVMLALSEALEACKNPEVTGPEAHNEALRLLSGIDSDTDDTTLNIQQVLETRFKQLGEQSDEELLGYPTGVKRLDELIGGWQTGIVSIVAARPGHGKSSMALATQDACSAAGHGVHLFSLEDTIESYADRVTARAAHVPADNIRRRKLSVGDKENIADAMRAKSAQKHRWILDRRAGLSADEIVRTVRRKARTNQTRVVIVDYLQLVRPPKGARFGHEAVSLNLHTLADAAKNDGMAYLVLSQFNRGIEEREDRHPQLSDLRESGTIEERAKCIIGLYRGSAYSDTPGKYDTDEQGNPLSGSTFARCIELCVLKNSNGKAPARLLAHWDGPLTRIW